MPARRDSRSSWTFVAALGLVIALLLAAEAAGSLTGLSTRGPLVVLDHLLAMAAVFTLLAVATGTGSWALRRLGLPIGRPAERAVFAVALGSGIVSSAILGLGAVGLLQPALVWGLVLALGSLTRDELGRGSRRLAERLRRPALAGEGWPAAVGTVVLAAVALFLLVQSLAPPADWDALMYHLRIPAQFAEEGRIFLPDDNLHVTRIGLAQMLYVPLLGIGAETGPALLSAAFAILVGVAGFAFCDRFFDRRVGWSSLALWWGSTIVLMISITPRVDVTEAFFAFIAHYAVLLALERRADADRGTSVALFALIGAMCGFAVGVKFQGALYAAALGPFVLWAALRDGRRGEALALVGAGGAAFVATAAPWLIKNVVLMGAPVYPAFAAPQLEPWLARLYGAASFPADLDRDLTRVIWELRGRLNPVDFFLHPERLAIEAEARYYYGNPILLLLPVAALLPPRRVIAATVVPALLFLIGLLLLLPEANPRYLIPAFVPLTLAAVHAAMKVSERLPVPARRLALGVAFAIALFPTVRTMLVFETGPAALRHAVGAVSAAEVLGEHWEPGVPVLASLSEDESLLPPGSRALLLFEARGFYLGEAAVQDNRLLTWPLVVRTPGFGPRWCPADAGFTHVLLNRGAIDYYRRGGMDPERFDWAEFEATRERCLAPSAAGAGLVLFRDTTYTGAPAR